MISTVLAALWRSSLPRFPLDFWPSRPSIPPARRSTNPTRRGYNNMQLFQTPDYVVILNEMVHDARIVPLDGRPHLSADLRQWMGDSRGH